MTNGLNALQRFGLALTNPQSLIAYQNQQEQLARQQAQRQEQVEGLKALAAQAQQPGFGLGQALEVAGQNPDLAGTAINVAKLAQEMNKPQLPFEGTGVDSKTLNLLVRDEMSKGVDLYTAQKNAVDRLRSSEVDTYVDEGGNLRTLQRSPLFGGVPTAPAMGGQLPISGGQTPIPPSSFSTNEELGAVAQTLSQPSSPKTRQIIEQKRAETALEKEAAETGQEQSLITLQDDLFNMQETIDTAISQTGTTTSGFIGDLTKGIAGSPAADLAATLSTIQADAAFDRLQQMRDASKTGGALGQVSERELGLLQNARTALFQEQSPKQLRNNLAKYKRIRARALKRVAGAFEKDYGYLPEGFNRSILDVKREDAGAGQSVDPSLLQFMSSEDRALFE